MAAAPARRSGDPATAVGRGCRGRVVAAAAASAVSPDFAAPGSTALSAVSGGDRWAARCRARRSRPAADRAEVEPEVEVEVGRVGARR